MTTRRPTAALAAFVVVCSLGACGTDEGPDAAPEARRDGLTAPGTKLAMGRTAIVPRANDGAVFALTADRVEQGDPADLEGIGLADADTYVPYYVHYDLELKSGDVQGLAAYDYLSAWAGDTLIAPLIVSKPFAPCQEEYLPSGSVAGSTVRSCRTYLVPKGDPGVDTVKYDNREAYQYDDDTAITWQ